MDSSNDGDGIVLRTPLAVGLVYDDRMMAHEDPSGDHPEQPLRVAKIFSVLISLEIFDFLESRGLAGRYVSDESLLPSIQGR